MDAKELKKYLEDLADKGDEYAQFLVDYGCGPSGIEFTADRVNEHLAECEKSESELVDFIHLIACEIKEHMCDPDHPDEFLREPQWTGYKSDSRN